MQGYIEFVDKTSIAKINQAAADVISLATSAGKYTEIWRKYDNLECLVCLKKATENGVFAFHSYETQQTNVVTYIFNLNANCSSNFIEERIELDATENPDIQSFYEDGVYDSDRASKLISTIRGVFIGQFVKLENGKLYIENRSDITPKRLPKEGFIYKSLQGDIKRIQRREEAQIRIYSGKSGLPHLSMLLDNGQSMQTTFTDYRPITEKVKSRMMNNGQYIDLNDAQQEAVRIAINTPDIALIQGPPGTGKTTVIRAIAARFEEIYIKNNGKIPRILVTSFQHDAVENAIARMENHGLPVKRIGGRRNSDDKERQLAVINTWIRETTEALDKRITELTDPTLHESVQMLRKRYFAWTAKKRDIDEGIEILKMFVQL
ncbi:MAG TPA: hypothetical protein DF409_11170, partial [Bacteroidales bacterium]|nr:hypothetical protein [Bacteroidales bacterium]